MAFGITDQGFVKKRLEDVSAETEQAFRDEFGAGFDLDPRNPAGQLKGILDERISLLWELAEAIYFSQYPDFAEGINLDNVVALNGITRKAATFSTVASARARGTFGTVIPGGTIISVSGNPDARFLLDNPATINVAATDEVQALGDQGEADAGDITIEWDGETTGTIPAPLVAATIQTELEGLSNIGVGNVTVAGSPAVNEVQDIAFANDPDSGSFAFNFDEGTTALIQFSDSLATIKTKIEAILGVDTVIVTGAIDSATGLTLTFKGTKGGTDRDLPTIISNTLQDGLIATIVTPSESVAGAPSTLAITFTGTLGGTDQPLVTIPTNTLTYDSTDVDVTPSETTMGDVARTGLLTMTAEDSGPIAAPTGSLTVIETPVIGLDSWTNEEDAELGTNQETDAELKLRRLQELQLAGAATIDAIRAAILALEGVVACVVFANNSAVVDVEGRPPHSVDIVVQGGDQDEIAETLLRTVAAGIETIGDIVLYPLDSQGFAQEKKFSRPTEVDIWLELELTINPSTFPANGSAQVEDAILAYAEQLQIGDDVIIYGSSPALICAIDDIPGITDVVVKIGTAPAPTNDDNIVIAPREIADFDSARITVVTM